MNRDLLPTAAANSPAASLADRAKSAARGSKPAAIFLDHAMLQDVCPWALEQAPRPFIRDGMLEKLNGGHSLNREDYRDSAERAVRARRIDVACKVAILGFLIASTALVVSL